MPIETARVLTGVLMLGTGLSLALARTPSVALFVTLVALGLLLSAAHRVLTASRSPLPMLQIGLGAAFGVLAAVALGWPGLDLRTLAYLVAAALVLRGLAGALEAMLGPRSQRAAAAALGSASVLLGLLVLLWPRLTVAVLGVALGASLVLGGLDLVLRPLLAGRRSAAPAERGPRHRSTLAAALALALTLVAVGGSLWLHAGDPRTVPDAFYTPPLVVVPDEPGSLIRSEPLDRGVPQGARAWRILYTTTGHDGSPAVSSGTVLAPSGGGPEVGELPVVSVAHGTTGVMPHCAPSLGAQPFADGAAAALEAIVRDGHAAVLTDYPGLGTAGPHPYLVGPSEAHSVWDALRAARQLPEVRLGDSTVVWGHSQGGHAALWTGMLARTYAPELELLGVAAFAPAADLYSLADGIKEDPAGKIVSAYIATAWTDVYPDLDLPAAITPRYRGIVERIGERCFLGRDVLAAVAPASQLFEPVLSEESLRGGLGTALRRNTPTADIEVPVLLAQGDADTLVLPQMQRDWVQAQCAAGHALDYREYPGLGHLSLVGDQSPLVADLLDWTADRTAGTDARDTCPPG